MSKTHVLFVEDEELIRQVVTETLIEAGFKVTEACNGEVALRLLQECRSFDLLLTDVHMPGRLSGLDVALHVRSRWPVLPVVFVTGRPDVLHAFGPPRPNDRCVLKPYKPTDVLAVIRSCVAQQALQRDAALVARSSSLSS